MSWKRLLELIRRWPKSLLELRDDHENSNLKILKKIKKGECLFCEVKKSVIENDEVDNFAYKTTMSEEKENNFSVFVSMTIFIRFFVECFAFCHDKIMLIGIKNFVFLLRCELFFLCFSCWAHWISCFTLNLIWRQSFHNM